PSEGKLRWRKTEAKQALIAHALLIRHARRREPSQARTIDRAVLVHEHSDNAPRRSRISRGIRAEEFRESLGDRCTHARGAAARIRWPLQYQVPEIETIVVPGPEPAKKLPTVGRSEVVSVVNEELVGFLRRDCSPDGQRSRGKFAPLDLED